MMERKCSNCVWSQVFCDDDPCRSCRNKSRWEFKLPSNSRIHYDSITTTNDVQILASNSLGAEGLLIKRNDYFATKLTPGDIKNVIFNDPATIVFWSDGTKTVVKCQDGEPYDAEKGLAMAISKKALGNQGNYCNVFKKWLPEEKEEESKEIELVFDSAAIARECKKAMETIIKSGSNFSAKKGI